MSSEVYWKVDNGPMTLSLVLDTVSVVFPPNNTASTIPYHTVELVVKSTTEGANRWSASGNSTRVILTGIETDGALAPWVPSDVNVLIYGDSITEGVLTLGGSQRFDTDHNDASVVYSYALGRLLGAETGVIGFGDNAFTHAGSGGVAPLGEAWNLLWEGVPRSFTTPKPDLIVLNEGTNDGCDTTRPGCVGTNITAQLTAVLVDLIGVCPSVPIAVLLPFNGGQAAHIHAAIKAVASPDVHFVDTTGFYNLSLGGSLHPTGPNDVAQIAPRIARRLRPILARSILSRSVEE
jgi:lysophospholipase L1-like esterase